MHRFYIQLRHRPGAGLSVLFGLVGVVGLALVIPGALTPGAVGGGLLGVGALLLWVSVNIGGPLCGGYFLAVHNARARDIAGLAEMVLAVRDEQARTQQRLDADRAAHAGSLADVQQDVEDIRLGMREIGQSLEAIEHKLDIPRDNIRRLREGREEGDSR